MARWRIDGPRKRRTRAHVLADLSVNHLERYALRCGFAVERMVHDYGIDLAVFTYNRRGEVENGMIWVQLKASDHVKKMVRHRAIPVRIERAHLRYWLAEAIPVMLVFYDGVADMAYWLHIQGQARQGKIFLLPRVGNTVTLHLPLENVLDEAALREFARIKAQLPALSKGSRHD